MSRAKGYVTYVKGNLYKGKTLWSFRISTEDKFFGCGTQEPKVTKNDLVEFDYQESNGRYDVDISSITHLSRDVAQPSAPASGGRPSAGRDQYWVDKELRDIANEGYRKANDLRIQYQSARNAAISVVDILTREKALKLPEKNPGEAILGKIEDLTNELFEKCSTFDRQEPVEGQG